MLSPVYVPWKNIKYMHLSWRGNLDDFKGHDPPPVFLQVMPEGPALSLQIKYPGGEFKTKPGLYSK